MFFQGGSDTLLQVKYVFDVLVRSSVFDVLIVNAV